MSSRKERLTVTVDPAFIEAGNNAVAEGRVESLSAWVNAALAAKVARERHLAALEDAVADYERKHGAFSARELADQARADRQSAVVVRGVSRAGKRKTRRGKSA